MSRELTCCFCEAECPTLFALKVHSVDCPQHPAVVQKNILADRLIEMNLQLRLQTAEIEKLKQIIATHELCHDSDGNVGVEEFGKSCGAFIQQQFGCPAPWMKQIAELEQQIAELKQKLHTQIWLGRSNY